MCGFSFCEEGQRAVLRVQWIVSAGCVSGDRDADGAENVGEEETKCSRGYGYGEELRLYAVFVGGMRLRIM